MKRGIVILLLVLLLLPILIIRVPKAEAAPRTFGGSVIDPDSHKVQDATKGALDPTDGPYTLKVNSRPISNSESKDLGSVEWAEA